MLTRFISKKNNRTFKAFLVFKDGGTAFEFEPREKKGKAKDGTPREPMPKIDFTGKEVVGKCPKCSGKIFDTEQGYLCENSQREMKRVQIQNRQRRFCSSRLSAAQAKKILADGKSDLLDKFISKAGKPFPAYLVMDAKGKITFDFPPREVICG